MVNWKDFPKIHRLVMTPVNPDRNVGSETMPWRFLPVVTSSRWVLATGTVVQLDIRGRGCPKNGGMVRAALVKFMLLMAEIPNNHLGYMKPCK